MFIEVRLLCPHKSWEIRGLPNPWEKHAWLIEGLHLKGEERGFDASFVRKGRLEGYNQEETCLIFNQAEGNINAVTTVSIYHWMSSHKILFEINW